MTRFLHLFRALFPRTVTANGLVASLLLGLFACVEAYEPVLNLDADLVVVDGILTNQDRPQTVALSRALSRGDTVGSSPIQGALVEVLVNGRTLVPMLEVLPGLYQLPASFRAAPGNTYQLRFRTKTGATYQSTVETMVGVPPILKAYDQINPRWAGKTINGQVAAAHDVYVDFAEPANERNFYLWRWRLYEEQSICTTCQQGRYVVVDVGPIGSGPINVLGCVRDADIGVNTLYDYPCRGKCWDITYSSEINIFTDVYTNGQPQIGRKVASVPIFQRDFGLLTIEQLSLSPGAYRYYKLLADQTQNTGTLADSPPAPTAGNVRNTANPAENVVGYFSAAAVAVNPFKLDRNAARTGPLRGLFYSQTGRDANYELDRPRGGPFGNNLPSAVCVPNRNRTDVLPVSL